MVHHHRRSAPASRAYASLRSQARVWVDPAFFDVAPNVDTSNVLVDDLGFAVCAQELDGQVMREICAVIDDVQLLDGEDWISGTAWFGGKKPVPANRQELWPSFKICPRNLEGLR